MSGELTTAGDADVEGPADNDVSEDTPLLSRQQSGGGWKKPRGFIWIEIALFANVFLQGFDGTITASTYAVISSEFNAANTASWLTTSYLITSTAFQPLYGRFSDIFGRRVSFFFSTVTFAVGCLGCAAARDVVLLNVMRAVTGVGGGGLMTMATVVNSDMIPLQNRGMYQAAQNTAWGIGSICGASLGGLIADSIGWRYCFYLQVPVSVVALIVGALVIVNPPNHVSAAESTGQTLWKKVDFSGSLLLILGLSLQLLGLSLGGNELPWSSAWVIMSLVGSCVLLILFFVVEARTSALPIIPLRMLRGRLPLSVQLANVCVGMAAYAFLFMLPLFFQVVLLDSAAKAGSRLVVPSLATPIGGIITGVIMSRWGHLTHLVRIGCILMALGNGILLALKFSDSPWKYYVFVFPANLGQGIVYPAILFTFLSAFEHAEHAASSSTVYLIRSLGTVWGVALTSAIVQNTLKARLPGALHGVPHKARLVEEIRHSVAALRDLPPDVQLRARLVYFDGIRLAFAATTTVAVVAVVASLFVNGDKLRRTRKTSM